MSVSAHPVANSAAGRSSPGPGMLVLPSWIDIAQAPWRGRGRGGLDQAIPPSLRPLVRAYLLGYASSVAPRLLTVLLTYFTAHRRQLRGLPLAQSEKASLAYVRDSVQRILRAGLEWRRFPTFCATLVGGSTLLQVPFLRLLAQCAPGLSLVARTRLSRWLASFVAAYGGLRLLQSKQTPGFTETVAISPNTIVANPSTTEVEKTKTNTTTTAVTAATAAAPTTITIPYAGRTLDLTLFAVTRAVDVVVGELWERRKARRVASGSWTGLEALVGHLTDPAIFSTSSALVMWAWFYVPSRLPHAYNKWITSAASVDVRLINALRLCRNGQLLYGKDMGPDARLLESMSHDYGWPMVWGDPATTVPFPCTMVHMDCGPSCEHHALMRMWRSWRWSMATYLPLSLLLVLRKPYRNPRGVLRAVLSAMRSSAFLGAFITLFFYGVCLARTRIGPLILGTSVAARQTIDSGLCTAVGCGLCGWSILIERTSRRKDMGLFVAPRALATLLPRRYSLDKQWRETLVFAASTAVVFTAIQENPRRVRGVMGGILKTVLVP